MPESSRFIGWHVPELAKGVAMERTTPFVPQGVPPGLFGKWSVIHFLRSPIMASGCVVSVTDERFDDEVLHNSGTVLVDFYTAWCRPVGKWRRCSKNSARRTAAV